MTGCAYKIHSTDSPKLSLAEPIDKHLTLCSICSTVICVHLSLCSIFEYNSMNSLTNTLFFLESPNLFLNISEKQSQVLTSLGTPLIIGTTVFRFLIVLAHDFQNSRVLPLSSRFSMSAPFFNLTFFSRYEFLSYMTISLFCIYPIQHPLQVYPLRPIV